MFTVRWVTSSFTALSIVWLSSPVLKQHFCNAAKDEIRQSTEKPNFKKCMAYYVQTNFVKNLALMTNVLNELRNVSEALQNRNTILPKAHNLLSVCKKRIECLID